MDVLFVCVGNAARSQIAKAFYNHYARRTRAESAGTEPAKAVSRKAIEVMREKGIDMSNERPKLLTQEMVSRARRVVTMGCLSRESCPAFLAKSAKLTDWNLEDPKGKGIEEYRRVRDEIEKRVRKLIKEVEG